MHHHSVAALTPELARERIKQKRAKRAIQTSFFGLNDRWIAGANKCAYQHANWN